MPSPSFLSSSSYLKNPHSGKSAGSLSIPTLRPMTVKCHLLTKALPNSPWCSTTNTCLGVGVVWSWNGTDGQKWEVIKALYATQPLRVSIRSESWADVCFTVNAVEYLQGPTLLAKRILALGWVTSVQKARGEGTILHAPFPLPPYTACPVCLALSIPCHSSMLLYPLMMGTLLATAVSIKIPVCLLTTKQKLKDHPNALFQPTK